MHILVMGGTLFLGRHIVAHALQRGHRVTLFNRGQHAPDLFPEAEHVRGDRDHDLSALQGRSFDAVIDPSAYRPQQIESLAAALGDNLPHYTLISTLSAYQHFPPGVRYDESAPLAQGHDGYGALKAQSERAAQSVFGDKLAIVRPGLIVGPYDPTGRFCYWVKRLAAGGQVLAPGRPERPVQWIDVRDLALWCLHLAEQGICGSFNAVGQNCTMQQLLESCRRITGSTAEFNWLADDQLTAHGLTPWTELPLWIPESDTQFGGMMLADNQRAIAAGLQVSSIDDTVTATLAWHQARSNDEAPSPKAVSTLTVERERALLSTHEPSLVL